MKSPPNTPEFFDQLYRQDSDPWKFATDTYETQRYTTIYNALSHHRYKNIFEPGCSIGVLTEKLAAIAQSVQAFDISPYACKAAQERCVLLTNVKISCDTLNNVIPDKNTNLIVISEIGYYFSEELLRDLIEKLLAACPLPLTILASHWLGYSPDHILSGDRVQQIIGTRPDLTLEYHTRNDGFRLDRWRRP